MSEQQKTELGQVLNNLPDSASRRVILRGIAESMHEAHLTLLELLRKLLANDIDLNYPITTPQGYAQHRLLESLDASFRDIQAALRERGPYSAEEVLGEILSDEPPPSAPYGSN